MFSTIAKQIAETAKDPRAARLVAALSHGGTTTKPEQVEVLWIGEHLAAIRFPWVKEVIALTDPREGRPRTRRALRRACGDDARHDARLTAGALGRWIARLRAADARFPQAVAAIEREEAARDGEAALRRKAGDLYLDTVAREASMVTIAVHRDRDAMVTRGDDEVTVNVNGAEVRVDREGRMTIESVSANLVRRILAEVARG